jgi:hypothetical protein
VDARGNPLDDAFCPDCGYSLRGLTSDRCPECGFELARIRSRTPRIPWEHRRRIGRMRAFLQTIGFVTFRYRDFCLEVYRSLDDRAAARFRWCAVLGVVLVGALSAFLFCALAQPDRDELVAGALVAGADLYVVGAASVVLLIAFIVLTAMPRDVVTTRRLPESQSRQLPALMEYVTGVLAWGSIAILSLVLLARPLVIAEEYGLFVLPIALLFALGAILLCFSTLGRTASRIFRSGWAGAMFLMRVLLGWMLSLALIALALFAIGLAVVMVHTGCGG